MSEPSANDARRRIQVELDAELARQLEDWRRRQPTIPSVSACARALLARALETEHAAS